MSDESPSTGTSAGTLVMKTVIMPSIIVAPSAPAAIFFTVLFWLEPSSPKRT